MLRNIKLALIDPNPNQPRKQFDEAPLEDLAASIRENGLMQPITVTPREGRFLIVAGERRWRAHCLLAERGQLISGAVDPVRGQLDTGTIRADIRKMSDADVAVLAIIENLQRRDITQLEEARAYQAMLDNGYTLETLAKALGVHQPRRIAERVALLNLNPEYLALFEAGQLSATQAGYLCELSGPDQDKLFRGIKRGELTSSKALAAATDALLMKRLQGSMLPEAKPPSQADRKAARSLETRVTNLCGILTASIVENEIVAIKKVDPTKAGTLADKLKAMQRDMRRVENALREAAVQADMLEAAE